MLELHELEEGGLSEMNPLTTWVWRMRVADRIHDDLNFCANVCIGGCMMLPEGYLPAATACRNCWHL